jgi:integrase
LWIAKSRGGPACDPLSPQYDPSRPVFYYLHSGRSRRDGSSSTEPAPLTGRRYDTMAMRVQRTLPWANEVSVTVHFLRHTGASIVERIAGTQTARLFLRHADRTVTDTYTHSDDVRLAKAVETMTGASHPMAKDDGPANG